MHTQSCEDSINRLKKARDVCSSQLDSGALALLDRAIYDLEAVIDHGKSAEEVERLKLRALQTIAAFVSIATNVRDWMT